jgi:hypothetical protein
MAVMIKVKMVRSAAARVLVQRRSMETVRFTEVFPFTVALDWVKARETPYRRQCSEWPPIAD